MTSKEQFKKYYQLQKELDERYHEIALLSGLSLTSYMILYTLSEEERPYTQKEICDLWSIKKQTLHSAWKNLLEEEMIELVSVDISKGAILTKKGLELANKTVLELHKAEKKAFERFSEEERRLLLELTMKHVEYFKEETTSLRKKN